MSKERAKKYIQKCAWRYFPAQELWFRSDDNAFWAFEKQKECIVCTDGKYADGDITYNTITIFSVDVEKTLERLIDEKSAEGFECFAIELLE